MKHVDLPYVIGYGYGVTGPSAAGLIYIDGKCNKTLVTADYPGNYTADGKPVNQVICVCLGDKQKENAEYIVHACNMYPELIECLKRVHEYLANDVGLEDQAIDDIEDILAKAKVDI